MRLQLDDLAGMRRLARSLLRDASLADDAVQEASLAALKRDRTGADLPRAWWAAVVRNVAARFNRGRRRSEARERAAARAEAQPGADLVARRLALHRAVVAAVEELAPDYRDVVVRRWFDGMKPQRIAAELGVPLATVKTRLRRALAQLRTRLENEWGDGVAGFLMALARPRVGWSAVAPVGAGVIVMSAKAKVLIGVAVVALASAWVMRDILLGGGHGSSDAVVQQAAPAAAVETTSNPSDATAAKRVEQPSASSAVAAPLADPRRVAKITGVVLGAKGPFAGAQVALIRRVGDDIAPHSSLRDVLPQRLRQTLSAGDGSFEFADVPRGAGFTIEASAEPDLHGSTPQGVRAGQHAMVTIAPLARLSGTVRRNHGELVIGATVVASTVGSADVSISRQGKTDPAGRFEIDRLPAWPVSVQAFTVTGDLMVPIRTDLKAGERSEVELVLGDGFAIEGVVLDDRDGEPIADAQIHVESGSSRGVPIAVTDEAGRFEIRSDVAWPESTLFFVRADGYGFHEFVAPAPRDPPSSIEVRLHRGHAIRGRVVDDVGSPLPDAIAAVLFWRDPNGLRLGEDYAVSRSAADGRFVLADVDTRMDHVLLVRGESLAGAFVSVRGDPNVEEDTDVGDVVVRRGALVAGALLDGDQKPVPFRRVLLDRIESSPSTGSSAAQRLGFLQECLGRTQFTAADGSFAFDGVAPGEWRLRSTGEGALGNADQSLSIRDEEVHEGIVLSIDEGLSITGRVVDDRGARVDVVRILVRGEGEAPPPLSRIPVSQVAHPEPDGTFVIRGLPRGTFRLIAEFPGIQRKNPRLLAPAIAEEIRAGQSGVTLVMHDGVRLSGRVMTPDGSPAARSSVRAHDDSGGFLGETDSDADGCFELVVPGIEATDAPGGAAPRRSVHLTVRGPPRDAFGDSTPVGVASLERVALDGADVEIRLATPNR